MTDKKDIHSDIVKEVLEESRASMKEERRVKAEAEKERIKNDPFEQKLLKYKK